MFFVFLVFSCRTTDNSSKEKQFFENSIRRDANASELTPVVRIYVPGTNITGCTGYFIANQNDRAYIATGRHCAAEILPDGTLDHVNYDIHKWCTTPGIFVQSNGQTGSCKRVVIENPVFDMVILEADFTQQPSSSDKLTLAAFVPKVGTRLKMIGYPCDKLRSPNCPLQPQPATVTENCWVLSGASAGARPDARQKDYVVKENCAVYGGNSGGPMMVEGSKTVVGQPMSFRIDVSNLTFGSLDTAAQMGLTSTFLLGSLSQLKAEGIEVALEDPSTTNNIDSGFLHAGAYQCPTIPACTFAVVPIYNSSTELQSIKLYAYSTDASARETCNAQIEFACAGNNCINQQTQASLSMRDSRSFVYINQGHSCTFELQNK